MGLSLHYRGSFKKEASLSKMIEEVKDIVEVCNWEYTIYEKEFPCGTDTDIALEENIYGISFTPPKCETVYISFLSNRRLSSIVNQLFYAKTTVKEHQDFLYILSVKTQYAGVYIHKFIVQLFRYLKKQEYFESLEIVDEGAYWETGDDALLKKIFKKYVNLLDDFSLALETIPMNHEEAYENYFQRVMQRIHERNKNTDEER